MLSNPLPKFARWLATHEWVMRCSPFILWLERVTRRLTKDRMGVIDLAGLPSVQITVAGRKTGTPRTTPLLYVPDGDRYLLIGSNWGRPKHPVWSTNLTSAAQITARENDDVFTASVRQLTGVERKQAWDWALEFWPGYEMEHRRAGGREFRIFEVRRTDGEGPNVAAKRR